MKLLNILLLTVSIGSGHKRAAQSLAAAFGKLVPDAYIRIIDLLDFFPSSIVYSCLQLYFKSLAVFPQGYGYIYAWGNKSSVAGQGNRLLSSFLLKRLKQCIFNFVPDVVICTHATAAATIDFWAKQEVLNFYRAGVVTDFVVHRLWLYSSIDDYFVADDKIGKTVCKQNNLPVSKFHAFGIPVAENFSVGRKVINTSMVKHILVMGGGSGLLPMVDIFKTLSTIGYPLQITFITGNNKKLYTILSNLVNNSKQQSVQVLGFVDDVFAVMKNADLLISKAGGMTMSEALCVGLPVLLYRPLPGQERANADFLIEHGVAIEFFNNKDLTKIIDEIFRIELEKLKLMRDSALALAKKDANFRIAEYILNKLSI